MPKSRIRRKSAYTPPSTKTPTKLSRSRNWIPVLMVAMFVIGLLWIVTFYVSGSKYPLPGSVGTWNIAIGFGFIAIGFGLATQWK